MKYLAIYSDHVAPSGGEGGALLCHRGAGEVPAEGGGPPCGVWGVYWGGPGFRICLYSSPTNLGWMEEVKICGYDYKPFCWSIWITFEDVRLNK